MFSDTGLRVHALVFFDVFNNVILTQAEMQS